MRRQVLQALVSEKKGLTTKQLVVALRPNQKLSFDEEVERNATISRALHTLKSEHRAWPTKTATGGVCWSATSKAMRKF
jgi:hypothetical protein